MTDELQQNSESRPVSVPANDRRVHPRQRIRSLAYVHLGESNGGIVLNISESGIALQAAEALDAGESPLAMRIEIPRSRKRLEVMGEIMWVGESRKEAGLRFVDLQEDALKRIRAWMAREESPGTGHEESEEEVEQPVAGDAAVRAESVASEEALADRQHHVAEELAAQDEEEAGEVEGPVAGDEEPVEFDEEAADDPADVREAEHVEAAEDGAVAMEPSSLAAKQPTAAAPVTRKEEDRTRMIAPPVLTFEKQPQAPNSPHTPISGTHGVPAFAVAAAPPTPARYSAGDAASSLFPKARLSADPAAAEDGWKSFRVQLRSGWFLTALVLLLATISFVAGMAVRRGALNRVMGDVDDVVQPKSAPAPSARNLPANPDGNGSGAAASPAPAQPLQIEIVDLENHRWTIPAATGSNYGDASTTRQTHANEAASSDGGAPAASASKLPSQDSTQGAPPNGAAATAKPGAPLMLSLPETPISASGSVAIRATGMVPLPAGEAESGQRARNLQIGELINLVEPVYPPDARQARLEGTVKLHIVVGTNGEVESFHPVSGPDSLTHAAMIAVREWRYKPTFLNGKAVETQEDITFVFRLPN
jgi:TonB family protein